MTHSRRARIDQTIEKGWQANHLAPIHGATLPLARMPSPEVYDAEYRYWPWGQLISLIAEWVAKHAPTGGTVFDYMCGTGYLLGLVQEARSDLKLFGCDIEKPFVDFAHGKYQYLEILHANAFHVSPSELPDIILCTAGLHHLRFDQQDAFLDKLLDECGPNTFVVIGEQVFEDHLEENARRCAALRLSHDLIEYGLKNDWPLDQIDAAIEVLKNDLFLRGEYKRSAAQWRGLLRMRFVTSDPYWGWRSSYGGGDLFFVCRRPKRQ
jgi:SAM-dependent methyltransferase